jgi:hypothetical protein
MAACDPTSIRIANARRGPRLKDVAGRYQRSVYHSITNFTTSGHCHIFRLQNRPAALIFRSCRTTYLLLEALLTSSLLSFCGMFLQY